MREKDKGRGQAALAFVEMMLGDPGRVEALGFGMGDLLGDQAVAFAGRYLIEQAAEEAQAWGRAHASKSVRRGGGQNQCSFCREWRP